MYLYIHFQETLEQSVVTVLILGILACRLMICLIHPRPSGQLIDKKITEIDYESQVYVNYLSLIFIFINIIWYILNYYQYEHYIRWIVPIIELLFALARVLPFLYFFLNWQDETKVDSSLSKCERNAEWPPFNVLLLSQWLEYPLWLTTD